MVLSVGMSDDGELAGLSENGLESGAGRTERAELSAGDGAERLLAFEIAAFKT